MSQETPKPTLATISAQRWGRIKPILENVANAPAERREELLEKACGDDENLRHDITELLAFEPEMEDFLAQEPGSPWRPAVVAERIGNYRLERLLGEGGMGTVYLARREGEFEQQVALKVLRLGLASDDVVRRFHNERQVLAHLEHPAIAHLIDGGTSEDGAPYLVMEYVEGIPIDHYCDERGLSVRRRLELFTKVLDAVHFAHQKLVVHRDLKPGNILVTAAGEPKLLDFGIAKLLDPDLAARPLATDPDRRPMTRDYASPEQILGEAITTATDVYGLGVLLYHLLTGSLPYDSPSKMKMPIEWRICKEEPMLPSTAVDTVSARPKGGPVRPHDTAAVRRLRRRLAGDVDAIILKAIRKEPRKRYGSVAELDADIRRHLGGLPVLARRGTVPYRLGKLLRRHRGLVAALLVIALLISAFTLSLQRQLTRTARERDRAETVTGVLVDLFEASNPDRRRGEDLSAREILDRGRSQIEDSLTEDPETRAVLLGTLARIYRNLGDGDTARQLFRESLTIHRELTPGDSPEKARRINNVGAAYLDTGEYAEAAALFREALEMRRRLGHQGTDLARNQNNLATALQYQGAYEEAEEVYRHALEARIADADGRQGANVATSLRSLGVLYYSSGRPAQAEPLLREALELRIEAFGADDTRVASVLSALGRTLHALDRPDEAETALHEALRAQLRRLGDDHPDVAWTKRSLAEILLEAGEPETAEILLRQALTTLYRHKDADDWHLADAESVLGAWFLAQGREDVALPCLRESYLTLRRRRGERAAVTLAAQRRLLAHPARGE